MKSEIYKPPESKLVSEDGKGSSESIAIYEDGYNPPMIKAVILLIFLQFLLVLFTLMTDRKFEYLNLLLSFVFSVSQICFFIFLIAKLRGVKIKNGFPYEIGALGVWGYIWRVWVVQYGAIIVTGAVLAFSGISRGMESPSFTLTTIFGISTFPLGIVLTWLLFSRNRKEQVLWVITIFRGY